LTFVPLAWVVLVVGSSLLYLATVGHGRGHIGPGQWTASHSWFYDSVDMLGCFQFVAVPVWLALTATIKQPIVGLREPWRLLVFLVGMIGIAATILLLRRHSLIW
jgi:hypothetical protein